MINFSKRDQRKEMMDDFGLADDLLALTLREIAYINKVLGGNAVTLSALSRVLKKLKRNDLKVADLGCGRGELMAMMSDWAERKGHKIEFTGIDASAFTLAEAEKAQTDRNFRFLHLNALDPEMCKHQFDVVNATLFCHHLKDEELLTVLKWAKTNSRVLIINDLHRHPLAYHSIKILTGLFSKSAMVKNDAPLSVLRAFHRDELMNLLQEAGFHQIEINWRWAFRWQVIAWS